MSHAVGPSPSPSPAPFPPPSASWGNGAAVRQGAWPHGLEEAVSGALDTLLGLPRPQGNGPRSRAEVLAQVHLQQPSGPAPSPGRPPIHRASSGSPLRHLGALAGRWLRFDRS